MVRIFLWRLSRLSMALPSGDTGYWDLRAPLPPHMGVEAPRLVHVVGLRLDARMASLPILRRDVGGRF